ncbi:MULTISPECIES: hypothetical protein [unclassified Arthrobacter]|uniref:hypothetical protein n=1 Tax=unclassified Arthrobacter TaxID=235627 RepID=UPI0027D877AD|nr:MULTISPECIES: hypothetical protein [unclassified Arthrobacter]
MPADIVEIRVHGIGNKELLDALGRPRFERLNPACEVTTAPPLPPHEIRIINWARSNKEFTKGFFWYVALPFTFANVIGYMRPAKGSAAFFATISFIYGLLLTATQVAWAALIVETALSFVPIDVADKAGGGAVPLLVASALALVMLYRASEIQHANDIRDPGPKASVLAANILAALAAGGYLSSGALPLWLATLGLDPAFLNPMLVVIIVSTAVAYFLAAIVLLLYMGIGRRENENRAGAAEARTRARIRFSSRRRQYAAAALVMIVAILIMHALGALLRIAVSDLMWLLRALAFPNQPVELHPDAVTLLVSADDTRTFKDNLLDMVPAYALGVLAFLGICWRTAARVKFRTEDRWPRPRKIRAELRREAVQHLGRLLPKVAAWFLALSLVLLVVAAALTTAAKEESKILETLIGASHALSYVVILATVAGQFPEITSKTRLVADIVGFWPIRNHPLAGVSYRRRVVAGIRIEMSRHPHRTVLLVGHSQGSVICAWLIRAGLLPINERQVHLITCGCPLLTLYSSMFPAFYTAEDFRATRQNVASWTNFWRTTDAISSKVPCAVNRMVPEPGPDGLIEQHGNYWTSPLLLEELAQLARVDAAERSFKPEPVPEPTPKQTSDVTILRKL